MGKQPRIPNELFLPANEEEAVQQAVARILQAASYLATAADMAGEGEVIEHYINSAIRLRDLANSLLPDRPEWPDNVIPFMPRPRDLT